MDESLLNVWWMRWAVLLAGAIIVFVARGSSDESFRGTHTESGLLFDRQERDSVDQGRWNRLAWIGIGAAMVLAGLLWTPLTRYLARHG